MHGVQPPPPFVANFSTVWCFLVASDGVHHPDISIYCGKHYYSLVTVFFMKCKLHIIKVSCIPFESLGNTGHKCMQVFTESVQA